MGLRDRIKGRLNRLRGGIDALKDEAKHPGRPADHRIAGNPFYESEADRQAREEASSAAAVRTAERAAAAPSQPPTDPEPSPSPVTSALPDPNVRPGGDATDQDAFWFLDGTDVDDGWDQTNPSKPDAEE